MMTFPIAGLIRIFTMVASLLLLSGIIHAQVAFRTTAGDVVPEGLNYLRGKQDTPVQVEMDLKSCPYAVTNASPLVFYTLQQSPDGKLVTNQVASVNLEAAGTLPLLIFFKGGAPSQPYRIVAMKEDATSFPGGTCRFANFSPIPVYVSLGGDATYLPPNAITDKPSRGDVALLNISVPSGGTNIPVITHNMLLERDKRYLFMVVPNTGSPARVALKLLTDRVPR